MPGTTTDDDVVDTTADSVRMEERSPLKAANQLPDNATAHGSNKRPKVAVPVLEYPAQVDVPSRGLVQVLFEQAAGGDQQVLADAGLLSFERVLLPAIAVQEEAALKKLQAVVQRDEPERAGQVESCRKAVYDSVGAAMRAVAACREARKPVEQEREAVWAAERLEKEQALKNQVAAAAEQEEELKQMDRLTAKHELKKKLPKNQELWREVAYLMTELSKLQKEERLWRQAQQTLEEREAELQVQEVEAEKKAAEQAKQEPEEEQPPVEEIGMVQQTIQDLQLSSVRIQQALEVVSGIVTESDQVRKELYHRYRKDHQFHGYPGIKDPKGLLSVLSQSQDF